MPIILGEHSSNRFGLLLAETRAGLRFAMGELFKEHGDALRRQANKAISTALRARTAAADLVQQTMLEAFQQFEQFRRASPGEFHAWLAEILENTIFDLVRTGRTHKRAVHREAPLCPHDANREEPAGMPEIASTLDAVLRLETARLISAAIAGLPEIYRQVLELRQDRDVSFREIGGLFHVSEGAAGKLYRRALTAMGGTSGSPRDYPPRSCGLILDGRRRVQVSNRSCWSKSQLYHDVTQSSPG